MGFNFSDSLSSRWLSQDDVPRQGMTAVIKSFTQEEVGNDGDVKPCAHFYGSVKPMLINRTNARILQSTFGDNSDAAIGQEVIIYNDPNVQYGGKLVGGLRFREVVADLPPPVRNRQPVPFHADHTPPDEVRKTGAHAPITGADRIRPPPVNQGFDDMPDDIPF